MSYRILDENKKYRQPSKEDCLVAVNEWMQKTSATEFIWAVYQINIRLAQIVANKPSKYKASYGDRTIKYGFDALNYCMLANEIYVGKELSQDDFALRRKYFKAAIACLRNLMASSYIFLNLNKDADGVELDKILAEQGELAIITSAAIGFITNVMKYDKTKCIKE